jgi:hypothetical protein
MRSSFEEMPSSDQRNQDFSRLVQAYWAKNLKITAKMANRSSG